MGTFPREVVIAKGYGIGLSTMWGTSEKYDIIEHPALVKACWDDATEIEAQQALINAGFDADMVTNLCWDAWNDAVVRIAYGPYVVVEYNGRESIMERSDMEWRE